MIIRVYDNDGKTADRYTIVIDNSVYTMSDNPLAPNGINQYCGEFAVEFVKKCLLRNADKWDEKRISISALPQEVCKAILSRITNPMEV